jgi:hypothetical protein
VIRKTPWQAVEDRAADQVLIYPATDTTIPIAVLHGQYRAGSGSPSANAAHIVRCVNIHEALVGALRIALIATSRHGQGGCSCVRPSAH